MPSNTVPKAHDIGWRFDNSYAELPYHFYTKLHPSKALNPRMVISNHVLAKTLGLDLKSLTDDELAQYFSGNTLPVGATPLAQAYAGHQFGHFTYLGDGRAHLIGEHITPNGKRVDIQLKGSGQTPYARRGDGRAALGPMLREYIISEAMHALGIPTTRSLAVVTTGEPVYRETVLQGAILTRVASSHLRVGTFEYLAAREDVEGLKQLADYAIQRHYPEIVDSDSPYLALLEVMMHRQINLITEWMRVGFIHGVMNTDNMTISGETIDYGPCAFMDSYDPSTVFSSIDHAGRYAYANQPHIAQWNIARFAEALLPLLHDNIQEAVTIAENTLQSFGNIMQQAWLGMMRRKLGLLNEEKDDVHLVSDLLKWMQQHSADYTNTFHDLTHEGFPRGALYQDSVFAAWYDQWQQRLTRNAKPLSFSIALMRENNPVLIARNHQVELALKAAEEDSDFSAFHELLKVLSAPYDAKREYTAFTQPPPPSERVYQTFCGT